jgi:hypothetical protein
MVILAFGVAMAAPMLDSGMPLAFLVIWYVVSVAQLVWAAIRYLRRSTVALSLGDTLIPCVTPLRKKRSSPWATT